MKVCKRWRELALLAWSTRATIRIDSKNMLHMHDQGDELCLDVFADQHAFDEQVLDKLLVAKSIGHALTTLDMCDYSLLFDRKSDDKSSVSLTALAQRCFTLEHLDLRQANETKPYTKSIN